MPEKKIITLSEHQAMKRSEPSRRTKAHDVLPACAVCKAPAGEQCVDGKGRTLPSTAVHAGRVHVLGPSRKP